MLRLILPSAVCFALCAQDAHYQPRFDLEQGYFLKALAEAEARLRKNDNDALAWAAKSQALCSLVRFVEAEDAVRRALKIQPDLPEALVAAAMSKAGKALQQKNLNSLRLTSQAMDDLRSAVQKDPDYPLAWATLGLGYQQLPGILGGSTKRALECAEQLRRLQPARGDLLHARVLSMGGRWNEAEPYFKKALASAPSDTEIVVGYLNELGEKTTKNTLGETAQKQKLAIEARRLLPFVRKSARGVEAVSLAFLDADLNEDAWKIALEALPSVDAPSIIKLQLGKVAARTGLHDEEGLTFLDQAAREPLEGGTGGYASVHWRRGQILKAMGRIAEAREAALKALSYNPGHSGAKSLLSGL